LGRFGLYLIEWRGLEPDVAYIIYDQGRKAGNEYRKEIVMLELPDVEIFKQYLDVFKTILARSCGVVSILYSK
jgi:hypothetical protein